MQYNWGMRRVAEAVLVAAVPGTAANAQTTIDGGIVSITDVRPLMKAAEYVTGRYGIPVAYEDLPASAYAGGPPPPSTVRFRARSLPTNYTWPADTTKVAAVLQEMLEQNAGIGNAGRFRVLTTAAGLVIAPREPTILDAQISFAETDGSSAFAALDVALHPGAERIIAATGPMESAYSKTKTFSANNEVAREVLVKLLNGLHRFLAARGETLFGGKIGYRHEFPPRRISSFLEVAAGRNSSQSPFSRAWQFCHGLLGINTADGPEFTYTWDATSNPDGTSGMRYRRVEGVYRALVIMEKTPR